MKRKKDPLGLESFESAFFKDPVRIRKVASSKTTWTGAYLPYLRRLATVADTSNLPLGPSLFEQTLETYTVSSRSRQQCGVALSALAKHNQVQLPEDWTARAAGYGLDQAKFRRLPTDKQILEAVELIPNPAWKLVYGLLATYGLRNHEAFFCDLSTLQEGGDRVIRVLPSTKTGEHQVWPFNPEWVDHFGLEVLGDFKPPLPDVCTDLKKTTLQNVGRRVSEQFKRYGVPFTPYDLRHAWAVRTIHMSLPDTVAARMMGHSVSMHTRTYHHWITRRDQQQAVDTALARLTPLPT
jgi:integrase